MNGWNVLNLNSDCRWLNMANTPIFSSCFSEHIAYPTSASAPTPPPAIHYDPGVYAKIENNQMVIGNQFFPTTWTGVGQANALITQLVNRAWMKGMLVEAPFGEICTGAGTYNWTFYDKIFSEVLANCPNKKIMLLLPLKAFGNAPADVDEIIPAYLQTTDGTYVDGKTRYDYLWNYIGANVSGYHFNLFQFQNGLTGNDTAGLGVYTFRDAYYAFLQAVADRYGHGTIYEDIFAGIMTSESASLTQNDSFITLPGGASNSVNNHFKGRIALLRKIKEIFPYHPILEDCNFNNAWTDVMTGAGTSNGIGTFATDGLPTLRVGFTQSNYHTGTNLYGWTNIHAMRGLVIIAAQAQGLDQDSKSGEFGTYYNYPDNPISGWPDSSVTNNEVTLSSVGGDITQIPVKQRPPNMQWEIDRAIHFGANYFFVQHNYSNANSDYGYSRYNWEEFANDMDVSVYANDPLGGMNGTEPTIIV